MATELLPGFFQYWMFALAATRNNQPLPPFTDGQPQGGYYWLRKIKDGPRLPVGIWREGTTTVMTIDGYVIEDGEHNKTWLACARHPVSHEDFEHCAQHGNWPGTRPPQAVGSVTGDNAPSVDEAADVTLIRELDAAKAWVETLPKDGIDSDALADEASNRVAEIRKLRAVVVVVHAEEKRPHLEQCRDIDAHYQPLIKDGGRADAAIKFLLGKVTDYLHRKKAAALKEAEAKRLREEAAIALAREANAKQATQDGPVLLAPAVPPAPLAPPQKQSFGGMAGNKISERTQRLAVIVDQEACYQFFKDNPEVKAVLQRLAQTLVKAKQPVPGVEVKEELVAR